MRALFVILTFYFSNYTYGQSSAHQSRDSILIKGVCFDHTTAIYLPVDAFVSTGNKPVKVGQSDKNGVFSLLLPRSASQLSFQSPGYRTVTLPVHIVGRPSHKAEFRLGIIMSKVDSAVIQQTHHLLLSYDMPDSLDVKYSVEPTGNNAKTQIVTTAHGNRVASGGQFTVRKGTRHYITAFEGAHPGPYRILAFTTDGRSLVDSEMMVREGVTLMEVSPNKSLAPDQRHEDAPSPDGLPASKTLFFEQSRYELTNLTKGTLDSIARSLTKQPGLLVQITGYAENIGERKLNVTLSEYRAKTVANYLKQKGIPDKQINTDWKGTELVANPDHSNKMKGNNRCVVVQFLQR